MGLKARVNLLDKKMRYRVFVPRKTKMFSLLGAIPTKHQKKLAQEEAEKIKAKPWEKTITFIPLKYFMMFDLRGLEGDRPGIYIDGNHLCMFVHIYKNKFLQF